MANLYTKTGDKGQTSLVGGSRINKDDLRVVCYGTVDEMGSALGFAKSLSEREYIQDVLSTIQKSLFSLAGELASDEIGIKKMQNLISEDDVKYLENVVDKCTETTGIQTQFVLPGENPQSGALHMARTVVRRCERCIIRLSRKESVREVLLKYTNRLSDAVYALARLEETLTEEESFRKLVEAEVRRHMNIHRKPFTLENIEKMAKAAREKAKEMNLAVVFAAVDEGGNTILLQRMEGALLASVDIALNKAYTSNSLKQPTHIVGELALSGAELYGIQNTNNGRIVIFGGGFPYEYEGKIVGAIGVSGGTVEQDMEIARYALENAI